MGGEGLTGGVKRATVSEGLNASFIKSGPQFRRSDTIEASRDTIEAAASATMAPGQAKELTDDDLPPGDAPSAGPDLVGSRRATAPAIASTVPKADGKKLWGKLRMQLMEDSDEEEGAEKKAAVEDTSTAQKWDLALPAKKQSADEKGEKSAGSGAGEKDPKPLGWKGQLTKFREKWWPKSKMRSVLYSDTIHCVIAAFMIFGGVAYYDRFVAALTPAGGFWRAMMW